MEVTAAGEEGSRWAEIAYEAMASVYDDFTAHHDYELWLGQLLPKVEGHGLGARGRLLDVGCGTGKSFIPMLERGWSVTACDLSPANIADSYLANTSCAAPVMRTEPPSIHATRWHNRRIWFIWWLTSTTVRPARATSPIFPRHFF